jgi:surface protein
MSKKSSEEEATPPPSDGIRSWEDLNEQLTYSASAPNIRSASIDSTTEAAAGKPEEIEDDSTACPVPFNSAIFEDDEGAKKRAAAAAAVVVGAQLSSTEGREDSTPHPTIFEDDNAHPMPLHSIEDDDEGAKKRAAAAPLYAAEEEEIEGLIEVEDDGYHPAPFNSANFEDDEQIKRRAAAAITVSSPAVVNNEMTVTATYDEEEALGIDKSSQTDGEKEVLEIDNGQEEGDADSLQQGSQQSSSNYEDFGMVDLDSSVAVIPHAYLVEDDDDDNMVIAGYAEPIPPWWKQRRTRGMFAVIFLVLLTAAVGVGISESKRRNAEAKGGKFISISPTQSNAPSTPPSEAPTISFAPSSSPTLCSETIVSSTQEIDISMFSLENPKVAIDGRNMVVAATTSDSTYIYVMFYTKASDRQEEWTRTRYFVEECKEDGELNICVSYHIALSGNIALAGYVNAAKRYPTNEFLTPVSVFEQTDLRQWWKLESLSVTADYVSKGENVDGMGIDQDLVCLLPNTDKVCIFRKISGGWEKIFEETIQSRKNGFIDCKVSGDTIVIFGYEDRILSQYLFDRATNSVERVSLSNIFMPEEVNARSLDGNNLVLSGYTKGSLQYDGNIWDYVRSDYTVYIYKRYNENEPFLLRQRLVDYEEGFGRTLDLYDDTLVVSGNNRTFVFMDHGDFFEESITLDKTYTGIDIFNRQVVATTEDNRVETFVISEDCTQLVPTQTPSLSAAPSVTSSPSASPSETKPEFASSSARYYDSPEPTSSPTDPGKPSSSPSMSYSPTEKCFMIHISFDYDDYLTETIWTLTQVGVNGENGNVIKSYRPQLKEDQSRVESICLKEGRYKFTVKDWDGICCDHGLGHYNVTSYGQMIVQGGKFQREEARIFDLPYDSNLSPSQAPSVSSAPSPTLECFATRDELKPAVDQYVQFRCNNDVFYLTSSFDDCRNITSKYGWPMNSWCVGNVTDMSDLFREMRTFNDDISWWDVSQVQNMSDMFNGASSFNRDVSLWNVSQVQDMRSMFDDARSFNGDLSLWDVSQVQNMSDMFRGATSFNGDLSLWNVSQVQDMRSMFYDARSFNGDVSLWDVSQVQNMSYMFQYASSFNGDVSSWNVSLVQDMSWMFSSASSFNGDLSLWDVGQVQDMSYMFYYASSFNGDISLWNVSQVQDMSWMFYGAWSFNQDLCAWADKNFPYAKASTIFAWSGCTYQSPPQIEQGGPFCASTCTFTFTPSCKPSVSSVPSEGPTFTHFPTASLAPTITPRPTPQPTFIVTFGP